MKRITAELMKEAHKLTKKIKDEYQNIDYKFQLGLSIKFLLEEKEVKKVIDLKGTPKQISWAEKIRKEEIRKMDCIIKEMKQIIENAKYKEVPTQILENMKNIYEEVITNESATFWIDNRGVLAENSKNKARAMANGLY